jgi:hypothetical protein
MADREPSGDIPPTNRPELTISQAAKACDVGRSSIRRRLDAGAFPDAHRTDDAGPWVIPVDNLLAAGLHVNRPADGPEDDPEPSGDTGPDGRDLEISELRRRAEVAEARAALLERNVEDLRTALRMLEAGPDRPADGSHETSQLPDEGAGGPSRPRRRWWWQR